MSRFVFLAFLLAVSVALFGLRIGQWLGFAAKGRIALAFLFVCSFGIALGSMVFYRSAEADPAAWGPQLLYWTGLSLLGLLGTIVLTALPLDLFWILTSPLRWLAEKSGVAADWDPERRAFLGRATVWGFLGLSLGTTAFGIASARRGPRVKRVDIPVKGLHPDLEGFTIAQISDLHVGPTIQRDYVAGVVSQVNELSPDLVAVTGDLVDGRVDQLRSHVEPLKELKAKHGIFYVTGNHEYYSGVLEWIAECQRLGMSFLLNENRVIERGSARLLVGGVPDIQGKMFVSSHDHDPGRAAQTSSKVDFKLLLAHRPQSCFEAARAGFDLQICGHTHAGQFYPWAFFVPWAHPYYKGLNRHEDQLWVYVNAGTGYWGPPTRFGVPSEITLLTLRGV